MSNMDFTSKVAGKITFETVKKDGSVEKHEEWYWKPGSKNSVVAGATAGAVAGSFVPGVGTVVGAAVGAVAAAVLGPSDD